MRRILMILAGAAVLVFSIAAMASSLRAQTPAQQFTVLDYINFERMNLNPPLYPLLPDAGLQAAAAAGVRAQARRGRTGHHGTMPSSSAEGAGSGRPPPNFQFSTCFHTGNWHTKSHRYAGAAIYQGYATLSLDKDRNHGGVGSAGRGGVRSRVRILGRIFGGRRS